jgi:hypothetical protein
MYNFEEDVECNNVLKTSKCKKVRSKDKCPSGFGPDDQIEKGCKGRLLTPANILSKPNCYRLFVQNNVPA